MLRHNIRNDINIISGYIDMVHEELQSEGPKGQLDRARERSHQIATLSEKIRILGEIDIAEGPNGTSDLAALAEESLEDVRDRHDRAMTFEVDVPDRAPVRATPAIRHAITELIDNAVEHAHSGDTDSDEPVSVGVSRQNGTVELTVVDDGPGIPPHEIAPLEAENESELRHMSGVGLWIAKWLCEVHGGTIEVETGDGGTKATLVFPAATREDPLQRAVSAARNTVNEAVPESAQTGI